MARWIATDNLAGQALRTLIQHSKRFACLDSHLQDLMLISLAEIEASKRRRR